ncbi:hypothetical protein IHE49_01160 [Rhodanobacter sp. 7MK24]|uniref:hypothetical protein n=1 Tax=Rhodanobacter sp. 7MK24 TaxID=2775922 RepID=UPI0017800349|nr:hypothetical protein [Rhodanobacter sp. 7MK24]MBD8879084.1 hypothetical protein [Rhodanobacter sp. 7MK24]
MADHDPCGKPDPERQRKFLAGIAIGTAIGGGIGVAMHNLALGIGLGVAIGVAMGAGGRKNDKSGRE